MKFLRALTNFYKTNLPKVAKSFSGLRDRAAVKECARLLVYMKNQGTMLPQRLSSIEPTLNYFRSLTNLHDVKPVGVRSFATKKTKGSARGERRFATKKGKGGSESSCKKLGVKSKKKKKRSGSEPCQNMSKYSCKSVKSACGAKKQGSGAPTKCKKEENPCKSQNPCGKVTIILPPPCGGCCPPKCPSPCGKPDPCKKKSSCQTTCKKEDPCKKPKSCCPPPKKTCCPPPKPPCPPPKSCCPPPKKTCCPPPKPKPDPCKKSSCCPSPKSSCKKEDPCKKKDPCKKPCQPPKSSCDQCGKRDPCAKWKSKSACEPCKKSACDKVPCCPANKKPCQATCRTKKDDDDCCKKKCKQSESDSGPFVLKNQDTDVVEDLTCRDCAYNQDEEYLKEVDNYFCEGAWKNQQYHKTHEYTYYDVVRYMQEMRASKHGWR